MICDVNISLLKIVSEKGHCLCNLQKKCPCDDFLNDNLCKCNVFKPVNVPGALGISSSEQNTIKAKIKELSGKEWAGTDEDWKEWIELMIAFNLGNM